jgi:hypothetical protein
VPHTNQIALRQKRLSNPTMLALPISNFYSLYQYYSYLLVPV